MKGWAFGSPPGSLGCSVFGGCLCSGQDPDWWLNLEVPPLTSERQQWVPSSDSQNPSDGVGRQRGLSWAPPLQPAFHLLFQTNMKLLP